MRPPSFQYEKSLLAKGFRLIAGIDEVGCGALAGPVIAAAVIFPIDSHLGLVRDSKLLSPEQREGLYPEIIDRACAWATGSASVEEIDKINIRQASLLAMKRAIDGLFITPDFLLVDAWKIPSTNIPQEGIVRGDRLIKSIAAASIVAKVTRDRLMAELAKKFPAYGFEIHKGYGTKAHKSAIDAHGPCEVHRLSYKTFKMSEVEQG